MVESNIAKVGITKLLIAFVLLIVGIAFVTVIADETADAAQSHAITKQELSVATAKAGFHSCFDATRIEVTTNAYTPSVTNLSNISGGLVADACYDVVTKVASGQKGWDLRFVNSSCCATNSHTDHNETISILNATVVVNLVPDSNQTMLISTNSLVLTCVNNESGASGGAGILGLGCMAATNYTYNSTGQVILKTPNEINETALNFTYTYNDIYNQYYNASNTTYLTWSYHKLSEGWARTVANLVPGFFALALFIASIGFALSAMKDLGVLEGM